MQDQQGIGRVRRDGGKVRNYDLRHIGDSPTYRRSERLRDPELFHSQFKRRGLDIKPLCRALGAANTPVASLERPNNMGTFGFLKGAVGGFDGLRLKGFMAELDPQYWPVSRKSSPARSRCEVHEYCPARDRPAWLPSSRRQSSRSVCPWSLNSLTKAHDKSGMSSGRSRRAGSSIGNTSSR